MAKHDELKIDETGVCYSLGGERYHRLAWYARGWSWGGGGYWRSVCGVLDSVICEMRMIHTDDRYYAWKISDKTACKRCFPNGGPPPTGPQIVPRVSDRASINKGA